MALHLSVLHLGTPNLLLSQCINIATITFASLSLCVCSTRICPFLATYNATQRCWDAASTSMQHYCIDAEATFYKRHVCPLGRVLNVSCMSTCKISCLETDTVAQLLQSPLYYRKIVSSNPSRFKPKTIKIEPAALSLGAQH